MQAPLAHTAADPGAGALRSDPAARAPHACQAGAGGIDVAAGAGVGAGAGSSAGPRANQDRHNGDAATPCTQPQGAGGCGGPQGVTDPHGRPRARSLSAGYCPRDAGHYAGAGFDVLAAQALKRRNAHSVEPGHAYDRYSFGRTLGAGIFSTVVEGTDKVTGEKVAIKVMDRSASSSPRDECILMNEVDILKTVRRRRTRVPTVAIVSSAHRTVGK